MQSDLLIETVVAGAEIASGVDVLFLSKRMDQRALYRNTASKPSPDRKPDWTSEEHQFLAENLGRLSHEEIGSHIGRSQYAVKLRQTRTGLPAASKQPGWLTSRGVARTLGVDEHAVIKLGKRGILPLVLVPGKRNIKRIKKLRLYMWAINPEHWCYFRWSNVKDQHLKRLIELAVQSWPDEWWTPGQSARYFGVGVSCINQRIRKGSLPATRWGNWRIKRSDVIRLKISPGKGSNRFWVYKFTDNADRFLLKAIDEMGLGYANVGRMMKISDYAIKNRYLELKGMSCQN